jgi:hypothetical protein
VLDLKGFSDNNPRRMKLFLKTDKDALKLAALWREISWTNNLIILSRAQSVGENEFYLRHSAVGELILREIERRAEAGVFRRTLMRNRKAPNNAERISTESLKMCVAADLCLNFSTFPQNENSHAPAKIKTIAAAHRKLCRHCRHN